MGNLLDKNVFEYLNNTADEKVEFFLKTRSQLARFPNYWFNYDNVEKNMAKYDEDIYIFDSIINKESKDVRELLLKYPNLIKYIPQLLGIRENSLTKGQGKLFLKVQEVDGENCLNFQEIEMSKFEDYFQFMIDSGLVNALTKGLSKSIHDYAYGVEAGLDSNGRKNRSGEAGEIFLDKVLEDISKRTGLEWKSQVNSKYILENYGIELGNKFNNRQFDGALYNTKTRKLYLIEINNFNSSGSKSKASATEFIDLSNRFSKTNNEFIYITDGDGWKSDISHLHEAMENIVKVFNYNMIESGFLYDYLTQ